MTRRVAWGAVFTLAAAGALAPLPAPAVERWYSQGVYPVFQRTLTRLSNLVPFSLFDALCLCAIVAMAIMVYRVLRTCGWKRGSLRAGATTMRALAVIYLAFLATWGLNYRRVPLTAKLAFDASRVTRPAAGALAGRMVVSLNRLYGAAHRSPTSLPALAAFFHDAQRALESRAPIVPGRPKGTFFGGYFHDASISGMTDPFFLETMIAPDLLDVERPFVIAHEWGHLAGYADESEANFLAWLTCMRGDESAQYSAWLALVSNLQEFIPKVAGPKLDSGPRLDLFAIRYRYSRTSPALRAVARESYDKYLKANRVARGIESYDVVLQLILGTAFEPNGDPRFR